MIIAIIQARMGSSRLPGKIMLDLSGKPVLWHVVNRVKHSKCIDQVIVATSIDPKNDIVRDFCYNNLTKCFSGSEEDVLDRYYNAALSNITSEEDIIVRITADCPLIDPQIIDETIKAFLISKVDYASNSIKYTYPDGLDCEVMKFSVLREAWMNAKLKSEREHVTPYIRNHPEVFKLGGIENDLDLSSLRWTLDHEEDYCLIKMIYNDLYNEKNDFVFLMNDIIDFINKNPRAKNINSKYKKNEGLMKSLLND